jgi:hypothetical protein
VIRIHLTNVDLGQRAREILPRFDKLRQQFETHRSISRVAEAFQGLLDTLAGNDLGAFYGNKAVVEQINSLRELMGLDLFVDERLTHQVSLSCVAPQAGYPNGRWDTKLSRMHPDKNYQEKSYYKTFPRLYLGQRVHKRPF